MTKRIFLDTNVVIDYLSKRMPFAEEAMIIFSLPPQRIQLCISALSFTTIFYVLKKHFDRKRLLEMLNGIQALMEVLPSDEHTISQAIQSDFSDFEDAVQYHTALSGNIDAIITRNPKDYINSAIPVYTPSEFIQVPYWAEDTNKTMLNEPDLNQLRTRKS